MEVKYKYKYKYTQNNISSTSTIPSMQLLEKPSTSTITSTEKLELITIYLITHGIDPIPARSGHDNTPSALYKAEG